jgi:hypothetical protein
MADAYEQYPQAIEYQMTDGVIDLDELGDPIPLLDADGNPIPILHKSISVRIEERCA